MENCKPVHTPIKTLECEKKSSMYENEEENVSETKFREAVCSLIFLSNTTRPDITYAVNVVSRRQHDHTKEDWKKVLHIFKYLKGTSELGLLYEVKDNEKIECYVDASLGSNDNEGKSTTGYAIYLFGNLISWRCKKQKHVALSSAEAEFISMSTGCKEVVSLKEMSMRLLKIYTIPTIYKDNKAAIKIAMNEDSQTFKHVVKLSYHYVRYEVSKRNVTLKWISSSEQIGDFFHESIRKEEIYTF